METEVMPQAGFEKRWPFKLVVIYVPWLLLIPFLIESADIPEFVLLALLPAALACLSVPGLVRASGAGTPTVRLVRLSVCALLVSLACPFLLGVATLLHPAPFTVVAYGIALIASTAVSAVAALLLLR